MMALRREGPHGAKGSEELERDCGDKIHRGRFCLVVAGEREKEDGVEDGSGMAGL